MDFSTTNIHCSSIGAIMSTERGRTNMQKWEAACNAQNDWISKFSLLDDRKKQMKNGENMLAKIDHWGKKAMELEEFKDIEPLSKTARYHLKKVYGYAKYHKWSASSDKGTKYTNKGTLAEQDSIDLVCRLENRMFVKNEERINNDFLTGIPDCFRGETIHNADYIIDVKTSWDIETFLDNLCKPLNPYYWWQIQGYLAITGAKYGEVSYCLVNTPQSLLNGEKYRLKERMDIVTDLDPVYLEKEQELINNLTFDDMPEKERRLRFLVEKDDEAIEKVYKRVIECRKYLAEIEEAHLQGVFLAKEPVPEEEPEENLENNDE